MVDLEALSKALQEERDILFAYLFGSVAQGRAHEESDLDLAVYLEGKENKDYFFERRLELITKLVKVTSFDRVDLVILNEAPPILVYSVFKTGKLLFSRDEERRISFLVKNLKEYWDLEITCRPIYRAMKKRIEEGKFGLRGSN